MTQEPMPQRILIVFNTAAMYGMERGVIETFDALRPKVIPHFLLSCITARLQLPVLAEINRRNLSHSFLSDKKDSPRLRRPQSLKHLWQLTCAAVRGNLDVLKESLRCNVLYLPGIYYFYFAILACFFYRLSGRRVIYHFHDLITHPSRYLRIISLFATDFIHCTQTGREIVTAANRCIVRRRNVVLPYRVDVRPAAEKEAAEFQRFSGRRNILFIGQVSPHKGADILLEAFQLIAGSYDNVLLHILGSYGSPAFGKQFQASLEAEGLRGKVKYWGYQEDVFALLGITYIHVQPSPPSRFMDTFPRAVLEAMRQGVPTVCFRSGGLPEMIVHEQTGLICEEESVHCLAKNLKRFLDDPAFREGCGRQARVRYETLYSDQRVRELWLEFLKDPKSKGTKCLWKDDAAR